MDRRPLAVQFVAFVVVLGIPDGALGVLWPSLRESFHRPLGDLGLLAVVGTALYVAGGAVFATIEHRVRLDVLVLGACAASAATAAAWAAAGAWGVVLAAVGLFGIARGLLDAAVNASATGAIRRLGWLHAGWAIGGAIGPLLVAALADVGSWRAAVAVIAGAAALTAVAAAPRRRPHAAPGATPPPAGTPAALLPVRRAPRATTVVLITFAAYTAAEAGPVAWAYVVLTDDQGVHRAAAAAAVTGFWIALTAGRVALGVKGHGGAGQRLLDLSCAGLAVGLALFWLAPVPLAVPGLVLAGAASAAVFPLLVNLIPRLVGSPAASRTVGLSVAAAAVGGPVAVLLEGQLADAFGVAALGPTVFAVAMLLCAVNWGLWRPLSVLPAVAA